MENDARLRARVTSVLRASSVFGTLDDVVVQDLADVLSLQTVRGGEAVVREGDTSNSMLFVISGALRISRRDRDSCSFSMSCVRVRALARRGLFSSSLVQPTSALYATPLWQSSPEKTMKHCSHVIHWPSIGSLSKQYITTCGIPSTRPIGTPNRSWWSH